MSFVTEWSSADQRSLVIFAPDVLRAFKKYRQRFFWQQEGGGILLGRRRGRHLEVVFATEPSHKDKRSAFAFVREATGHAELAEQAWLHGEKQIDYLGEWHTHPQRVPTPSSMDQCEWRRLMLQRPKSMPILVAIVGTKAIHAELIYSGQGKVFFPIKAS